MSKEASPLLDRAARFSPSSEVIDAAHPHASHHPSRSSECTRRSVRRRRLTRATPPTWSPTGRCPPPRPAATTFMAAAVGRPKSHGGSVTRRDRRFPQAAHRALQTLLPSSRSARRRCVRGHGRAGERAEGAAEAAAAPVFFSVRALLSGRLRWLGAPAVGEVMRVATRRRVLRRWAASARARRSTGR